MARELRGDLQGQQIVDRDNLLASPIWNLTTQYITRHGEPIPNTQMNMGLWRQMQALLPLDWETYTKPPRSSDCIILTGLPGMYRFDL